MLSVHRHGKGRGCVSPRPWLTASHLTGWYQNVTDFSAEQMEALQAARDLIDMGVPIFTAKPNHGDRGGEFHYPDAWQTFRPHQRQVDIWRPGDALCMVTGVVFDVLDVDPRNGGAESLKDLAEELGWDGGHGPQSYGLALTPSAGEHHLFGRTMLAKTTKLGKGLDLQSGDSHGRGRGFVFIAPTVRVSKYGPSKGQPVAYRWAQTPAAPPEKAWDDPGLIRLREHIESMTPVRRDASKIIPLERNDLDQDAFADYAADWTPLEASRMLIRQIQAVANAREGEINSTLGGAARVLGRFVAGGWLTEERAVRMLKDALAAGGVHDDQWNANNRKGWTANTVIGAGLARGAEEPWTVDAPVAAGAPKGDSTVPALTNGPDRDPVKDLDHESPTRVARLEILSAADSAYWLQNELGTNGLSGFFTREGRVVHTPLVDQLGYVPPRLDVDENGPAQIQAVSPGTLAAKIQYAYACYRQVDLKGPDGKKTGEKVEVPALFPLQAAQRAVDAPEAMGMLRSLAGITLTPMVRPDGSILARPGYDPVSRYLFLPERGVNVPAVPEAPTDAEVDKAVGLLDEMLEGFPWSSKDDRANFLGLLLTPMLRLVTPPTYKMFGIGAHQPGSGKTLLAEIATALHGGVQRSEVPEDEPEWRKAVTTILSQTSAPVVLFDNITGVLKSSTLAGILTAGQAVTDRELGSNRMITANNDRCWVVTGNNLSLGGDLVRRTILIMIDPNMANPETRTDFKIEDLPSWVREHRNELLWSLLVMIRAWVAQGKPMPRRAQSDSFARWEATLAGILAACRIDGDFDQESGKLAAAGGDDDDTAGVLAHLRDRFADRSWSAAEALDGVAVEHTDVADFVLAGRDSARDWLPAVILDKLARSEAAGRKSFGYWLRNRLGRWVTDTDGRSLVIREAGKTRMGALWRIEQA